MKDYAAMSDFEINCLVATEAWLGDVMFFNVDSDICNGPVWDLPSGGYDDFIAKKGCPFDPCNNPADAWPIIVSRKVSMQFDYLVDEWTASCVGEMYYHHKCGSPLRAAMIVFLMMKEGE